MATDLACKMINFNGQMKTFHIIIFKFPSATGATSDLAYAQSLYGDEDEQSMLWYSDIHQINEEISQLIENCDRLDR